VLSAAKANAFGSERKSESGILSAVRIGPNSKMADQIGPFE
jgi:hypothetical protein